MKTKAKFALIIIVIVALVTVATVSAQEGFTIAQETVTPTPEPTPCSETNVSGTVVAVDEETGTVTIDTGEGQLCTIELGVVSGGHPIAVLLGQVFGNISVEDLAATLDATHVCVVSDGETWMLDENCEALNKEDAQLVRKNDDGTFTVLVNGQEQTISVDNPDLASEFEDALKNAMVDWDLDENGNLLQTSDEIQAYHEDGIGFGVLVKLYSIAAENDVSVQELVDQFKGGMGWGEIFKQYPKPEYLGVGHVRKAEMTNGDSNNENGEGEIPSITKSNGLGRGHGNTPMTPPGLAKKNKDTSTETTVQEPASSSSHPGKGKGPSKENPGKGNGKGKSKGKP